MNHDHFRNEAQVGKDLEKVKFYMRLIECTIAEGGLDSISVHILNGRNDW